MLSFVSSPSSIAEMKENWFAAQTCPSLVAAKRHASQRESPLHSDIFLKWALNRHCKVPICDIATLTAFLQTNSSRLAGNLAFPLKL
jgi:hypothetical protein